MARRRGWRYRQRRLAMQGTVLVVVVAFLSLGSPTNRATANTILAWLALRLAIGVLILLALWWAWEFARPPKVKRRKIPKKRRAVTARHVRGASVGSTAMKPVSTRSGRHPMREGDSSDITPPDGTPVMIPSTRDALIKGKMSGVSPLWPHSEEDD